MSNVAEQIEKRWRDNSEAFRPRTDRFWRANNEWYFNTREIGPLGPFSSKDEAEEELNHFLMEVLEKDLV